MSNFIIKVFRQINILLNKNVNDVDYIKKRFKKRIGKELNLDNPITFNEKLQWLKINDRNPIYTKMVDKYEVKKIVSQKIGERYVIPTIGIYDKWSDIDFNKLPNKFVIKCTHDSGGIYICKNKSKFNKFKAKIKIETHLKRNFYYYGREWPYKNVKPKILIEKYMSDKEGELKDYKFFCFNGKVKCFKIDFDRFTNHGANYYDRNGKLLHFGEKICPPNYEKKIEIPQNINEMMNLAEQISKNMKFVRVDFYNINKRIYFGEITFYPASGFGLFIPEEWDKKLGDWLTIK